MSLSKLRFFSLTSGNFQGFLLGRELKKKGVVVKVGFDLHGVLDSNPEFFSIVIKALIKAGQEVHIVSGSRAFDTISFCLKNKIKYTHIFSITDSLCKRGFHYKIDKHGRPVFSDALWEKEKARYCQEKSIDIMIDDTLEYGKHFKTPFFLFKRVKGK